MDWVKPLFRQRLISANQMATAQGDLKESGHVQVLGPSAFRRLEAQGVDRPLMSLEAAGYESLYAYRYDWNDQKDSFLINFSEVLGAAHASEISFIQGKAMYGPIGSYMYPDTDSARDMTDIMMTAWANFARDGAPGEVKGDAWAPFSAMAPHYMCWIR